MDDARVWGSEEGLWVGDAANYRETIARDALMVLPDAPYVFTGEAAVDAVSKTPRWTSVQFSSKAVSRPQEGLIVIAYEVTASREADQFVARCTTTYRRIEHDSWVVIQHQQSPKLLDQA